MPMRVDSMCTKLCGRQSLVTKNLECRHEEKNEDDFAIGVYQNDF